MRGDAMRSADATSPKHQRDVPVGYFTDYGEVLNATIEDALDSRRLANVAGSVNLIFTSPPFPLVRKKAYGNKTGDEYLGWLEALAPRLAKLLAPDGSIVIEIGNAWEDGRPTMSTLPLEALMAFKKSAGLHLCQQFVCHNPARLPGPAQWTNIERIRVKDSFTHVWWLASGERPKADNSKVLAPYSIHMKRLLKTKKYNSGKRPSGHVIGEKSFLRNNGGAIPPAVVETQTREQIPETLLRFSNTSWNADYVSYCKSHGVAPHPARMQPGLAAFFIAFLTESEDLVLDPFAGSNTTGAVAEELKRRWIAVEADPDYVAGSKGRFPGNIHRTPGAH
jgi:DNA modification methylase